MPPPFRSQSDAFGAVDEEKALEAGQSYHVDVGIDRALHGERIRVHYRGRLIDERIRHDSRLTIAVLNTMGRRTDGSDGQDH